MEEDAFFYQKIGTYLDKKRTSHILRKILKHRFLVSAFGIISICIFINFLLIYKFVSILMIL